MTDNQGSQTVRLEPDSRKLITLPVNLQSFLQTFLLICTLIAGVVYADRRQTQLELKTQRLEEIQVEQKDSLRQLNDAQQRSLANQERMLRLMEGSSKKR